MNCPICGKPIEWQATPTRPFCSERCKMIDFGAWVNEEYTVPAEEAPLSEETSRDQDADERQAKTAR